MILQNVSHINPHERSRRHWSIPTVINIDKSDVNIVEKKRKISTCVIDSSEGHL